MYSDIFSTEEDPRTKELRERLDSFYAQTSDYSAFHESNWQPVYWQPIAAYALKLLADKGECRILEFGAGRTGFKKYMQEYLQDAEIEQELGDRLIFDVQDVTPQNQDYLAAQAKQVYIGDLLEVRQKYDIIFSTFVWEHLTTPRAVLDHLLSLLNPGGSIFLISPRYDLPFYLSPSCRHLSKGDRIKLSLWLSLKRLLTLFGQKPSFLIHLDPVLFHQKWFRDADAIHWVSLWDLLKYLPPDLQVTKHKVPAGGLKGKIWANFCVMFVQIKKQ
jgi:SAM-dependent methyltransferase